MATRIFRKEKHQESQFFFFEQISMSTLMWITEKEQEPEIKERRRISFLPEEKHENFIAVVRK